MPLNATVLRLKDLILSKAEGDPFFIEEIVRRAQAGGCSDARRLHGPVALPRPGGPGADYRLDQVILARIDPLDDSLRETLRAASVIGGLSLPGPPRSAIADRTGARTRRVGQPGAHRPIRGHRSSSTCSSTRWCKRRCMPACPGATAPDSPAHRGMSRGAVQRRSRTPLRCPRVPLCPCRAMGQGTKLSVQGGGPGPAPCRRRGGPRVPRAGASNVGQRGRRRAGNA